MTWPPARTAAVLRIVGALAIASWVAGCGVVDLATPLPPGSRRWVITVENQSDRPAIVEVAEDAGQEGPIVGTVSPNPIPAGATVDVMFGIPPGRGWAIFVNPGPDRGPLITSSDVPPVAQGKLPVKIVIGSDGSPGAQVPSLPGWFGN
ncbi:MAG TPA: hypothetical protein VIZ22_05210 [Candidatus Limnocylindrales bacterium]